MTIQPSDSSMTRVQAFSDKPNIPRSLVCNTNVRFWPVPAGGLALVSMPAR